MTLSRFASFVLTLFTLLAAATNAHAASDYFLKIGDIKGESTTADSEHEGWIELTSVSWASGDPALAAGSQVAPSQRAVLVAPVADESARQAASPRISEVSISKMMDASSAKLSQACASGTHFPKAELHVRKAGGDPDRPIITAYQLFDVVLTCSTGGSSNEALRPTEQVALSTGGSAGDSIPMEQISLNFGRVEVKAMPVVAEPAALRPERITPKPAVQGPQTGR